MEIKYDRQQTLITVNHSKGLAELFFKECKKTLNVEVALFTIFNEYIVKEPIYQQIYNRFTPVKFESKDTICSKTIETIIKIYGWADFIKGLETFAISRKELMRSIGLRNRVEEWQKIEDKIGTLRKNPLT